MELPADIPPELVDPRYEEVHRSFRPFHQNSAEDARIPMLPQKMIPFRDI
jgi:hypothetical protein